MKKFIYNHREILGIFIIAILLSLPLFINPYHLNDDTIYHFANVISIEYSISTHGWFSYRILPLLANNFGYASGLLYPPLSQAVTAVFYHLTKSFLSLTNVFCIIHLITIFLSGLAMYSCAYTYSKDKKVSFFASILYMTYPYFLCEIYVRDALAESFIFMFLPMIFNGLFHLLNGDKNKFYFYFILGYVGGMLSHFTLMIYATFFFAIFLIVYRKQVFTKQFMIPFLKSALVVLLLVLFYIEPMIEYRIKGGISVFLPNLMSQGIYCTSIYPWEYIPFYNFHKDISYYFGIMSVILFIYLWFNRKKIHFPKYTKGIIAVFFIALLMSSKLFYFDMLPKSLYMIQFGWRLLTFTGLTMSLVLANSMERIQKKYVLILLIVGIVGFGLLDIHYRDDRIYQNTDEVTLSSNGSIGWEDEYLPVNAHDDDYWTTRDDSIHIIDGDTDTGILSSNVPNMIFFISNISNSVTIELPRFYYLGYELRDADNQLIPITENEHGFLETTLDHNSTYTLSYNGTIGMRIAKCLSIITFAILILYFIWHRQKNS